jgi:hypothetical protein
VTTLQWSPSLLNPRPGPGAFEMYLYRPAPSLPMRRYDWRRRHLQMRSQLLAQVRN